MMIHFDIDIPGVDLQNFSADAIPFSLWPEEASVSPAQVNLFTSLIQQAEQPSAMSPAMENTTKPQSSVSYAPAGNIAIPKSFVFRAFTSAPLPVETTAAQITAPQTQATVPAPQILQPTATPHIRQWLLPAVLPVLRVFPRFRQCASRSQLLRLSEPFDALHILRGPLRIRL